MKPLLVGESNPYGTDPHYALYPAPIGCAGWRLCHEVLGLRDVTYLGSFERVNLLAGKWSVPAAREAAAAIRFRHEGDLTDPLRQTRPAIILLGRKVADAFEIHDHSPAPYVSMKHAPLTLVLLPHPSGLCRRWGAELDLVERCREALRKVLPGIPFGEVGL